MSKKLKEYKERYEKLVNDNFEIMYLEEGEQVKHCTDDEKKKFYHVEWAVTNRGRIWSLYQRKWQKPRKENGYWRVENVYVHDLVDHYFMTDEEKNIKRIVEEHNKDCLVSDKLKLEVHHKNAVQEMDSSKMTREERIEACMKENFKENLMLQIEGDHDDIHKIMKGKRKLGKDKKGHERVVQFDSTTSMLINSGALLSYSYDDNEKRELNINLALPTLTPEEEKEYIKIFDNLNERPKKIFMFTA